MSEAGARHRFVQCGIGFQIPASEAVAIKNSRAMLRTARLRSCAIDVANMFKVGQKLPDPVDMIDNYAR